MSDEKKDKRSPLDIILEVHRAQNAAARSDTAVQKGRAQVSGGGKKPYRQKGTGNARQGTNRATQWRGGSRAFGAQPKNHTVKVNRKVRRAALIAVMESYKTDGRILTNLPALTAPSTAKFNAWLGENKVEGKVVVVYGAGMDQNLVKSARNLATVECIHVDSIHMQLLLGCEWLVVTAEGLAKLTAPADIDRKKTVEEGEKS